VRRDSNAGAIKSRAQRLSYTIRGVWVCFLCLLVVTLSPFSHAEEQTFSLETDKTVVKAKGGDIVELKVALRNTGTVNDSYEIRPLAIGFDIFTDWDNMDNNTMRLWAATINIIPTSGNLSLLLIDVGVNETYEFMVKIRVPDNAEDGESALIGIVAKSNNNYKLFANALITVTVVETPGFSFIATLIVISVSGIWLYRRN
tara:strand:+ start:151 stop:753 length:603 start_codon:yes stop_codon:yes gene_type:complete